MKTPDWIIQGFDSKADWEKKQGIKSTKKKGKTFKIRECPKCKSDEVGLVLSNSDSETGGGKEWECRKCKWKGNGINEKELTEDEFMKYLDKKGEEVA
jgi:hypothetical protein